MSATTPLMDHVSLILTTPDIASNPDLVTRNELADYMGTYKLIPGAIGFVSGICAVALTISFLVNPLFSSLLGTLVLGTTGIFCHDIYMILSSIEGLCRNYFWQNLVFTATQGTLVSTITKDTFFSGLIWNSLIHSILSYRGEDSHS